MRQTERKREPEQDPQREHPIDSADQRVREQVLRVALFACPTCAFEHPSNVRVDQPSQRPAPADTVVGVPEIFNYWVQPGRIDVGFLGAAQIDRYANINTTVIGDSYTEPAVRLPGNEG